MNLPDDLKYTKTMSGLSCSETMSTVGITDFAQQSLGDITYVEVPSDGDNFEAGARLESSSRSKLHRIYMPVDAEIVEGNQALEDAPEVVNESPFEAGDCQD